MGQNEQTIKIEGDILRLNRELKYATESLARVKADTQDVIATKERVTKEINERNDNLTQILNDISDAKLAWALEKQVQLKELEDKRTEVDSVIKRKAELKEQEETIRKVEAEAVKARNEQRALEFKNEQTELDFENREKQIKVLKKEVDDDRKVFEKDKDNFKDSVIKVLEKVKTL